MRDDSSSAFEPFDAEPKRGEGTPQVPETLPPVEPPSARFIIQLFVIPALIVGGVIGIYFLFGRLATGEVDWRQQVDNVRSQNPHVRWRGALSLAEMLNTDSRLAANGQKLAENPDVVAALTDLFTETRAVTPRDEQTKAQLEFLARTLGRLDAPDKVFPVLIDAINAEDDELLRKHGLNGLAMIAGRAFEEGHPLSAATLVEPIVAISQSEQTLDRHQAAFILGLLESPEAQHQLEVLLQDPDLMTRANAAIGLARHKSAAGLGVFDDVFADAIAQPIDPGSVGNEAQGQDYFERALVLKNSVRAVGLLAPELNAEQRAKQAKLLEQVADATKDKELSVAARELSLKLGSY